MSGFKPISPLTNSGVKSGELNVIVGGMNVGKSSFTPVSPKQMVERGATNHQVLQLLSTFDSPTGILEYGKDVMATIATKSDKLLADVKDSDVEFVETQMRGILTMAKSLHLKPKKQDGDGWLTGMVSRIKENLIDTKEQLLSEFNNVSTQMDRVISQVEQANTRILVKVGELQQQYKDNLQDYKNLETIINNAEQAYAIKVKEYQDIQGAITDALEAQQAARMSSNLDRLDKKIDNLKKFQMMCLQDAPNLAQMEDNAVTLLEKFDTIKTMTIPLWKKQIRMYIDGQELNRGAKLAAAVDDANNAMITANSNSNKLNAIETAKLNQRAIIDDSTAEQVHQNLLDTLDEVLTINVEGRQRRIESSNRMDEMKRLYASIGSGQVAPKDVKSVK